MRTRWSFTCTIVRIATTITPRRARSRTDAIFDTRQNWQSTRHETHVTTPPPHHPPPFIRLKTRAIRRRFSGSRLSNTRAPSFQNNRIHVSVEAYSSLAHGIVPFVRKAQSMIHESSTAHSRDTDDYHGRLNRRSRAASYKLDRWRLLAS